MFKDIVYKESIWTKAGIVFISYEYRNEVATVFDGYEI